jgi:cytochrome c oxidase subunit 3
VSLTVAYGALAAGVIVWLILVRKLSSRPWEATASAAPAPDAPRFPAKRVGLWVFLAVITSLFGLFISAYYMRMGHGHGADAALHDWHAVQKPGVLWLNTALLIFASLAMQWAKTSVSRGSVERTKEGLLLGGLLTLAFLAGQVYAWTVLQSSGHFRPSDPAIAFFYLLTAVHGLHLLGGLFVWGRTLWRIQRAQPEAIDVRLSVELCTVYWHYLLLVWLVLFGLLIST